jgi:hypothetical protein
VVDVVDVACGTVVEGTVGGTDVDVVVGGTVVGGTVVGGTVVGGTVVGGTVVGGTVVVVGGTVVEVVVVVAATTVVEVVDVGWVVEVVVVGTVVDAEVVVGDGTVVLVLVVVVVDGTVVLVVDVVLVLLVVDVVLVVVVVVVGVAPVPESGTLWGVAGALSAMSRLAVRVPVALGVKVTDKVQLDEGAIVAPLHVSADLAKSAAFAPDSVTLLTISGAFPVFWTVMVCAVLVVPVFWEAKVRLVGLSVTCGEVDDVPFTVTLCGP